MRMLHISSEYPPHRVYGLGRYVCDVSRELVHQGHSVHVLTNSIGTMDQDVMDHGVSVHRVHYPPPPKPPGNVAPVMAFNLHLQQRAHQLGTAALGHPEIVVSHDWLTALAGERLARRLNIPHIWTVHDTMFGKTFGHTDEPESQTIMSIERWIGQEADLVLVNSRAIQSEMQAQYGVPVSHMRILHCAIDAERIEVATSVERVAMYRRCFAEPDEMLVTFVGRLDLEKGIDTLINAMALVRRHTPRIRLALIGTGTLESTIREHIANLDLASCVTLYGYLQPHALAHLYRISDLHVCPSHYEPFGIVAIEAMAVGTPVIASDTGGLSDIFASPDVGCLVPPRDVQALARAIISLVDRPSERQRMGAAGAQHVHAHFVWSIQATRAAELYRECLQAPTSLRAVASGREPSLT